MTKKVTDTTEKETKKVLKSATPAKKLSAKAPAKKDADKKETEKASAKKAAAKKEEEKETAKKPAKKTAEATETKKASKKSDDAKTTKKGVKKADEKAASKDGKGEVIDDATRELFTQKIKEILSLADECLNDDRRKDLRYAIGKELAKVQNASYENICLAYLNSKDSTTQSLGIDIYKTNKFGSAVPVMKTIYYDKKTSAGLKNRIKTLLSLSDE